MHTLASFLSLQHQREAHTAPSIAVAATRTLHRIKTQTNLSPAKILKEQGPADDARTGDEQKALRRVAYTLYLPQRKKLNFKGIVD
jgi:hypothetical protein